MKKIDSLFLEKRNLIKKIQEIDEEVNQELENNSILNKISSEEFAKIRSFIEQSNRFFEDTITMNVEIKINVIAGIGDCAYDVTQYDYIPTQDTYADILDWSVKIKNIDNNIIDKKELKEFEKALSNNILNDDVNKSNFREILTGEICRSKKFKNDIKDILKRIKNDINIIAKNKNSSNKDREIFLEILQSYCTLDEAKEDYVIEQ